MLPRKRLLFALIVALISAPPICARGQPVVTIGNYSVHPWGMLQGLPQNSVNAIVQTHDGYIWAGTYSGLARFDGVKFTVFNNGNTPEMHSSRVTSLFESADGTLWIGHETGEITRFKDNKFSAVELHANWSGGKIHDIAADELGDIWLLNEIGLLARLRDGLVLTPQAGLVSKLVEMTHSADGSIWVSREGKVSRLNHGRLKPLNFDDSGDAYVQGIGASRDGGLWVASNNGLRKWKNGNWVEDLGPAPWNEAPVHRLIETKSGTLAVGTTDHGFYLLFPNTGKPPLQFNRSTGFASDWVLALREDREENLWVGTAGAGLVAVRAGNVQTFHPPDEWQGRAVLSVTPARDGGLWIGTEGAGLYRLRDGAWKNFNVPDGIGNPYIWSIAHDENGRLWLGTWGGGLFTRDGEQFIRAPGTENISPPMPAILASRAGGLWIGTEIGLMRHRSGKTEWFGCDAKPPVHDVRTVCEDEHGGVWFGMSGGGLACLKDGNITRLRKPDGLPSDYVECLRFDQEGALWIGTFGGGLTRLKNGRFAVIDQKRGLPNDDINHIEDDGHGYYWLSSLGGIIRVSKSELDACADGKIKSVNCLTYGISEGLPTLECSGGLQPAGCKTSDGNLWFPTAKGLVAIDPREVKTNSLPPPVVIEELRVDGTPVERDYHSLAGQTRPNAHTLKISPGRHRFDFQYTALSFVAPEKVRFKYRLDGLDEEWLDGGTKRAANYSYIPPGQYVFQVIACNNDDVWNEHGASIAFTVLPFFWQTGWFRVLAGCAMVLAGGGIVWMDARRRLRVKMERLQRQRAVERERARIAQDIHDDLGASLTRITMLSQSNHGAGEPPEKVADTMEQIFSTARELTRAMDEIVWAVNPKHDTLDSLANYLGKFAQDYLRTARIRCRLNLPVQLPSWPLTAEMRHNLFLAFKETLHNVVKHAQATEVLISLELAEKSFRLVIEDNGRGFDAQLAAANPAIAAGRTIRGHGLSNMRRRLEEIGGECRIESAPGRGTKIQFAVKVHTLTRVANGDVSEL